MLENLEHAVALLTVELGMPRKDVLSAGQQLGASSVTVLTMGLCMLKGPIQSATSNPTLYYFVLLLSK